MTTPFSNWSGSVTCAPSEHFHPQNEHELAQIMRRARALGKTVRPVGSGHSSTPLVTTDDWLVSLDEMTGILDADPGARRATVLPGTGLRDLGGALAEAGLGMENLGDVDYQSIAGAVATGTHGSGVRLTNLSSMVIGGTLVTGTGEVMPFGVGAGADDTDTHGNTDDMVRALQVSLGTLGILSSVTLRVRPAYELHRMNWITHIDWVLDHFAELIESNRSVDFYWYPRSDLAQVRMLNEPGKEPDLVPPGRLKTDETGPSYEIIPNQRDLKFEEMEYMLPLDTSLQAFREARDRIKRLHRSRVGWRVLVRTIAPDTGMLSPASHRATMTIALLQNATLPHEEYFADMEPLFRSFDGRPHWGKKHSLEASDLRDLYPEWDTFQRIREGLDPDEVLMNDYLRRLMGRE